MASRPAKVPIPPDELAARAFYEEFRDRLKRLREDAGYTQEDLCDLIGVPLASYKHIEGKRASKFPLHKIAKLAKALRVSCDQLLTGRAPRDAFIEHPRRVA